MITQHRYEQLRPATLNDVAGLLELLEPLERRGMLVARSASAWSTKSMITW